MCTAQVIKKDFGVTLTLSTFLRIYESHTVQLVLCQDYPNHCSPFVLEARR
jgi:hypothetical protein